jgi:hypothetical protein
MAMKNRMKNQVRVSVFSRYNFPQEIPVADVVAMQKQQVQESKE